MSTEANLKRQNRPYLWAFFIFNFTVYVALFFSANLSEIVKDITTVLTARTSSIVVAPLILFIISGLLSSSQKAVLVFWKLNHPLPGSRAFSVHAPKDTRIDIPQLIKVFGPLPKTPETENALWYKLYKKNCSDIGICKSHKDFLLGRELVTTSFLCILFLGISIFFVGVWPLSGYYFIFLLVQYSILAIVTQNYGKRFVTNVLAVEAAK